MAIRSISVLVSALAACGRFGFPDRADATATLMADAMADSPVDACVLGAWTDQGMLSISSGVINDYSASLAPDSLTLRFTSDRPGGLGAFDIWEATRPTTGDAFGTPIDLAPLNGPMNDEGPTTMPDQLELFFASNRNTVGHYQLFRSKRANVGDPWGAPTLVAELAAEDLWGPNLSADGTELFYNHTIPTEELFRATYDGTTFTPTGELSELSTGFEGWPSLSGDRHTLYFQSMRADTADDIWFATRTTIGGAFTVQDRVSVAELPGVDEADPEVSKDDRTLIWVIDQNPPAHFHFATRACQ